jgi:hypothetical protein
MFKNLGRLPRLFNNIPNFSLILPAQADIPDSINNIKDMPQTFGEMDNDQIGDCTCAAVYHAIQVFTFDASAREDTEPDNNVLDLYEKATGYNPADPSTDQGAAEQDILTYWLNTGVATEGGLNKLIAFYEIDCRKQQDIRRVIWECGVAYIGINLPQSVMNNADDTTVPWDVGGDETILGGHAIILVGYDSNNFLAISWGSVYTLTSAFLTKFMDEAYAIVDPAWIEKIGFTPLNMTVDQLEAQMQNMWE